MTYLGRGVDALDRRARRIDRGLGVHDLGLGGVDRRFTGGKLWRYPAASKRRADAMTLIGVNSNLVRR